MQQLNASDLPQFSPNDFYPFGHLSPRRKFWLQYTALSYYMRLRKKPELSLDLHRKIIYSRFWLQYYDAWGLKKSISLDNSSSSATHAWNFETIFIGTLPPPKTNCLQLQYYYGARNKKTIIRYYVNVKACRSSLKNLWLRKCQPQMLAASTVIRSKSGAPITIPKCQQLQQ